jgi:hypothetical protein
MLFEVVIKETSITGPSQYVVWDKEVNSEYSKALDEALAVYSAVVNTARAISKKIIVKLLQDVNTVVETTETMK